MSTGVRVIKLGGSLLEWSALVPSFRHWLSRQPESVNIVVVGGGLFVDALRRLNERHTLDDEVAHWLAVRAMGVTAKTFSHLLGDARLLSRLEDLRLSATDGVQVFDVERFLHEDLASAGALPCNWDVTSDSIAARISRVLGASELVLLKSTIPLGPPTFETWSRSGLVDAYFARAAAGLHVRLVNLRDNEFPQLAAC